VDADSGIITNVEVAPENVTDSSMFPDVADDAALAVTTDVVAEFGEMKSLHCPGQPLLGNRIPQRSQSTSYPGIRL